MTFCNTLEPKKIERYMTFGTFGKSYVHINFKYVTCTLMLLLLIFFTFLFSMSWRMPVFITPTFPCQRHLQPLALCQHHLLAVFWKMTEFLKTLKAPLRNFMLSWIYSEMLGGCSQICQCTVSHLLISF